MDILPADVVGVGRAGINGDRLTVDGHNHLLRVGDGGKARIEAVHAHQRDLRVRRKAACYIRFFLRFVIGEANFADVLFALRGLEGFQCGVFAVQARDLIDAAHLDVIAFATDLLLGGGGAERGAQRQHKDERGEQRDPAFHVSKLPFPCGFRFFLYLPL